MFGFASTTRWRRWALGLTAALACVCTAMALRGAELWAAGAAIAWLLTLPLAACEFAFLRAAFTAQKLAMRGAHDGLWWWDPISKRLWVGARLLEILGYSENILKDTHGWLALVHPDDRVGYNLAVARHLKGESRFFYHEYRVKANDGTYRWIASRGEAVRNRKGLATLMAGSVSDITVRRQSEARIRDLAFHDQLTGLQNRAALSDRLDMALTRNNGREPTRTAVLFIDIDRFKDINDVHGHQVGDRLLVKLAKRLRAGVRGSDTLARQGGDEFIVVLSEVDEHADLMAIARKLLDTVEAPIEVTGLEMLVTASIGISIYPDDASDADTLFSNADTAMYEAKAAGGNQVRMYNHQMNDVVRERMNLEVGLRMAINRGELRLVYQPKVSLGSGELKGCEALLRWHRTDGSLVGPDRFIPVAERCGMIEQIGLWVMTTALDQIALWRDAGLRPPTVAINVSALQLLRPGFAEALFAALAQRKLPAEAVEVEVTESVFMQPESAAREEMLSMRQRGVRLALDDFGTGYSSLSYLSAQEFDTLKIDRSFVSTADAGCHAREHSILRAMVAMARAFDMTVVAEGIEREAQRDALLALDCAQGQGYLFDAPLAPDAFADTYLAPVQAPAAPFSSVASEA